MEISKLEPVKFGYFFERNDDNHSHFRCFAPIQVKTICSPIYRHFLSSI